MRYHSDRPSYPHGHWAERERLYRCEHCGKDAFASSKSAKRVARYLYPQDRHISAYPCPITAVWHYGHDNRRVRRYRKR